MYQQPNAPQSIGGVLDSGFMLYRESLSQAYLLAAVGALVTSPVNFFLEPYFARTGVSGLIGSTGLLVIAIVLITVVMYAALIARIDAVARGAPLSMGQALSLGVQRMGTMLLSGLLLGVVIAVGFCLVIIPGLIFMIWLVFAPFAVVIERRGAFESLSYSRAIVRGHWWRTAVLLTIIGIVLMVVYLIVVVGVSIAVISDPVAASQGQVPWYVTLIVGQNHRHAVVKLRDESVRGTGQNCDGVHLLAGFVAPPLPKPGKGNQTTRSRAQEKRTPFSLRPGPLIEAVGGNEAATLSEGIPEMRASR